MLAAMTKFRSAALEGSIKIAELEETLASLIQRSAKQQAEQLLQGPISKLPAQLQQSAEVCSLQKAQRWDFDLGCSDALQMLDSKQETEAAKQQKKLQKRQQQQESGDAEMADADAAAGSTGNEQMLAEMAKVKQQLEQLQAAVAASTAASTAAAAAAAAPPPAKPQPPKQPPKQPQEPKQQPAPKVQQQQQAKQPPKQPQQAAANTPYRNAVLCTCGAAQQACDSGTGSSSKKKKGSKGKGQPQHATAEGSA
jgi:hypothetical protein